MNTLSAIKRIKSIATLVVILIAFASCAPDTSNGVQAGTNAGAQDPVDRPQSTLAVSGSLPGIAQHSGQATSSSGGSSGGASLPLDQSVLYSDGSSLYLNPQQPGPADSAIAKIRVGKNQADKVVLHYGALEFRQIDMIKMTPARGENFGAFDYWIGEIPPQKNAVGYYFEVVQAKNVVFYSRRGVEKKAPSNSYQFKILPGFTVPEWMKGAVLYQIYIDRFNNGDPSNDVLTNEYMYDNWPSVQVKDWNQLPDGSTPYTKGSNRTREFFGGDIEGVIQKLPYLKELGIDGIYFNPLFVSPSNHKYDAQDYENIDPHVGVIVKDGGELIDPSKDPNYKNPRTDNASAINRNATKYIVRTTSAENLAASNAKMKELIDKAHALGIRIIMDGVFNHSGSFNKWLDREGIYPDTAANASASGNSPATGAPPTVGPGAYESKSSPFNSYFKFSKDAWPNNESYEAWYGFKTLPKLFFENSPQLTGTIMGIGSKWVSKDWGVDGWRLDVAADLGYTPTYNHKFWKDFRSAVKAANPNAVILAEVYGDSSAWLGGDEWDTVMNYDAFFEPVSWYLTGLEKHSYYKRADLLNKTTVFERDLRDKMAKLPYQSLEIAMNQLSNHDHSRFYSRTSGFIDDQRPTNDYSDQSNATKSLNKGIMKEASVFQMTMPGAPTLYYGDEAGLAGLTDPDSRRTYPWGREDKELLSFYMDIIALHKKYSALKTGSYTALASFTDGVFAYARWDRANRVVVALNNRVTEYTVDIPLKSIDFVEGETFTQIFVSDREGHQNPNLRVKAEEGSLTVTLPAYGSAILVAGPARDPAIAVANRPAVTGVSPGNKTAGVDTAARILVQFDSLMNQREILEAFSISPDVEGGFAWNGSLLSFVPAAPLAQKTTYTVSIAPLIRSSAGNFAPDKIWTWSFTTK